MFCFFFQWSKPIMEKRRRERINRSLEELKRLVLEAQNRDVSILCCVSKKILVIITGQVFTKCRVC